MISYVCYCPSQVRASFEHTLSKPRDASSSHWTGLPSCCSGNSRILFVIVCAGSEFESEVKFRADRHARLSTCSGMMEAKRANTLYDRTGRLRRNFDEENVTFLAGPASNRGSFVRRLRISPVKGCR